MASSTLGPTGTGTLSSSASPPPQSVDINTLLTRQRIQHQLSLLSNHEQQLDSKLQQLISPTTRQQRLTTQLKALDSLSQVVAGIQHEAIQMHHKVADVADTAERVGGTVRKLDLEQVSSASDT